MSNDNESGRRERFPFTAIVGQSGLRMALLLLSVDPRLGGVLIQGEKGTAKTTAVRGLADLLPGHVPGERGAFVELPLSATEDRVVGSVDVQSLVADGSAQLKSGLISAADGGVLYVDEVNLLADNLVDVLLDAAATGQVSVERDGVSASADSRFALVGTMNPEEGELRPQLLDRFGLSVEVTAPGDAAERVEVITRRLEFEADPASFAERYAEAEMALSARIVRAREHLSAVRVPTRELRRIALVCIETDVQGLRADVVCARAAKAHAVLEGRSEVVEADVRAVASFVLPHRRRRDPFDPSGMSEAELDEAFETARRQLEELEAEDDPAETEDSEPADDSTQGDDSENCHGEDDGTEDGPDGDHGDDDNGDGDESGPPGGPSDGPPPRPTPQDDAGGADPSDDKEDSSAQDAEHSEPDRASDGPVGRALEGVDLHDNHGARPLLFRFAGTGSGARGRRSKAVTSSGRSVRSGAGASGARLDLVRTVRSAAHRNARERSEAGIASPLSVRGADLRYAQRVGRSGDLVIFLVDTSGSMAARRRLELVARSAVAVLRDAYVRRDVVGVVTAGGHGASVALAPTRSVDLAVASLGNAPTGGRTPLAEGIAETRRMLTVYRLRDPARRAIVLMLTDGRATAGNDARTRALAEARHLGSMSHVAPVVIDCEAGRVRLGTAGRLARAMGAPVVSLDGLSEGGITELVRSR